MRARHRQRLRRHILGDGRPRGGVRPVAHRHGRNKVRVAADEGVVSDDGAVLLRAVVVDRDRAAAEIHPLAHVAVAHIGQVRDLRPVADHGVLDLHKIADLHAVSDRRAGADVRERTDLRVIADGGGKRVRRAHRRAVAHAHVLQKRVRTDGAVFADARAAAQDRPGQQRRPRADRHRRIDVGIAVIPDLHALPREQLQMGKPQNRLPVRQLLHGRDGIHAVAVGVRHAVLFEEIRKDEFVVQRVHQRLPAHGRDVALQRRAVRLIVDGKRQNDRRTRHHDQLLLRFLGGGQKDVQLVRHAVRRRAAELHILREARARLALKALVADQKETPDAPGEQCVCQPGEQRRTHNILQHHRTVIAGLAGVVRHKYDCRQFRHGPLSLRSYVQLHYNREKSFCTGAVCRKSGEKPPIFPRKPPNGQRTFS